MVTKSELIEDVAESFLESDDYYQALATPAKSARAIKEQEKLIIVDFLESNVLQDQIKKALTLLSSKKDKPDVVTEEQFDEMVANIEKIKNFDFDHPPVQEKPSETFKEFFGLTDSSVMSMYKVGLYWFKEEKLEDAGNIFTLLVTLMPMDADFNCGLGLCNQKMGHYEDALTYYTLATLCDENHVGAHISAIECCIKLRQGDEAATHWEQLARISNASPEKLKPWEDILSFQKQFK